MYSQKKKGNKIDCVQISSADQTTNFTVRDLYGHFSYDHFIYRILFILINL